MTRNMDLVFGAYRTGTNDARAGVELSDEEIDNAVGIEYRRDYKRALADHAHLNKILGRGRWVQTNES